VAEVRSLRALVGETSFFYEVFGGLFASFGIAGLFMACVGLYGLLSWSVARRVPELGMRMALGATGRSMVRLVMTDAAMQTAIGLGGGFLIAALAGDALSVLLFQVDPHDPLVYAAVALLVGCVSMGAAAAPALRAARLDPMQAMRVE
jgi:ABC-type antimicrobial peptide transport system permease subunit